MEMGQGSPRRKPLAYRLRKSVQYCQRNGSPVLVLNYPLKAMVLDPFWRPVFESLISGDFVAFENILSLVNHADPRETEIFLNSLVRKGFLEQEGFPVPSNYPYISIIIPVRNRPEEIAACLQSLSRLDYPGERMEIIVVDDASDDHTPDVVSTFPVRLIPLKERRQASFCRNLAAQNAKGEILAFLDSDCLAGSLWLRELIPAFNDPYNGAVGGMIDSYSNEKGLDRYEKVKSSLNMGYWPRSSREGDRFFYLPSCNLLVRKALFLELGGFREDIVVGEDVDICWRVQDQGHHVEYRPLGMVHHKNRNKIRPFCARRFDYGTSEPSLQQSHARRVKQLILPPFDVLFWGLVLLFIASGWTPLLVVCCVILLTDSVIKHNRIRRKNISIPFPRILMAAFRGYLVILFNWCAFVSRYYLFLALPFVMLVPIVSVVIMGMHLLTGLVEYFIKKPRLILPTFLFYFTLDQFFYQFGVWWGCVKGLCFRPVNPRIVRRPFLKEIR